jgi:pilus assembly protein CpaB
VASRRVLILVAAVVIAAVAGFGAFNYLSTVQDRANKNAVLVKVYVVSKDIPKALGGDQALSGSYIKADKIQAKFRPTTAITNLDTIRGMVALTDLSANQVLVTGQFVEPRVAQLTNSQRIPKNRVAVTITIDQVRGVAGLLVPGDKVDLMVINPQDQKYTLLYQNAEILFIGSQAAPQPGETQAATNPGSNLITFSVPPQAAAKIAMVASQQTYQLYMTLVPPDNAPSNVPPVGPSDLFQPDSPVTPCTLNCTPYDKEAHK